MLGGKGVAPLDDHDVAGGHGEPWRSAHGDPVALATVAATDPAGDTMAPPAPWHGIFDARPIHARYLVHLIEECARHAGHADTIRE